MVALVTARCVRSLDTLDAAGADVIAAK